MSHVAPRAFAVDDGLCDVITQLNGQLEMGVDGDLVLKSNTAGYCVFECFFFFWGGWVIGFSPLDQKLESTGRTRPV